MKIEQIRLTKLDIEKCEAFAEASVDSSLEHYKKRRQGNRDKIIQDIICGKSGEIAAYKMMASKGLSCTKPDFEIYSGRKKSFDSDLSSGKFKLHLKSQTQESADKYGQSYILQWGGRGHGHVDKLFKHRTKEDFLIPTLVDGRDVTIYGIINIDQIFLQGWVKEPRLDWFKDFKRAIYLEDLVQLLWVDRWGILKRMGK